MNVIQAYLRYRDRVLLDALEGKLDLDDEHEAYVYYIGGNHPLTASMSYKARVDKLISMTKARGKGKLKKSDRDKATRAHSKLRLAALKKQHGKIAGSISVKP